jgi:hypothetical protein
MFAEAHNCILLWTVLVRVKSDVVILVNIKTLFFFKSEVLMLLNMKALVFWDVM